MLKKLIINKYYKFQYEKIKKSFVLLYPEGVVTLNHTSTEILKLCNGNNNINDIKNQLLKKYDNVDGLDEFVNEAIENKWIKEIK